MADRVESGRSSISIGNPRKAVPQGVTGVEKQLHSSMAPGKQVTPWDQIGSPRSDSALDEKLTDRDPLPEHKPIVDVNGDPWPINF